MQGAGVALSGQSLDRVVGFNGVLLNLNLPQNIVNAAHKVIGATSPLNAVSAPGQPIALPSGQFSTLTFLGTSVGGNQPNQRFTVTYTDGTTRTYTQSMSHWTTPQNYSGETVVATVPYFDLSTGAVQKQSIAVYGYSLKLNSTKTVRSITLPNNVDAAILAMTLS